MGRSRPKVPHPFRWGIFSCDEKGECVMSPWMILGNLVAWVLIAAVLFVLLVAVYALVASTVMSIVQSGRKGDDDEHRIL